MKPSKKIQARVIELSTSLHGMEDPLLWIKAIIEYLDQSQNPTWPDDDPNTDTGR